MSVKKDRIGFIIPTIYSTGWARNALPIFARTAQNENKSLFIFPGGRLNGPMEMESLRNSIYSLVNENNIDGLISWSSTIRYDMSEDAFKRFHKNFSVPFVTLEQYIPGHIHQHCGKRRKPWRRFNNRAETHSARRIHNGDQ